MEAVAGPFFAAALLLSLGGLAKVLDGSSAASALSAVRVTAPLRAVRALGAVEMAVGIGALAVGGAGFALLVGAAYLAFFGFVALALRTGTVSSCGCLGRADAPPSRVHLALNGTAVLVAVLYARSPAPALPEMVAEQAYFGLPFLAFTVLSAWLAYLSLTWLARLAEAMGSR
ncbi:MAG: hypothetical protein M3N51_05890 [Actinomycetota bacterium]|nr:hypothetical protein [Actinomycetota bacterium]